MIYSHSISTLAGRVKIAVELSKVRISLLVALSTLVGYLLAADELSLHILVPTIGVFLLACGSAALNQYQERRFDRLMDRTRGRPVASGRISPAEGLFIALSFMLAGALILLRGANLTALGLGLLNVLWYNGFYTPLKRKTPFAVVPGSVIGAIPPAIGWVAGGRSLADPQILGLAFFFFIWQVPHFWLLLLSFGDDYRKAGFPSLTEKFSPPQLARITFAWIIATAMACLLIPLFGLGDTIILYLVLALSAIWLVWKSRKLLHHPKNNFSFRPVFHTINIYILVIMFALSVEKLILSYR